MGIGVFEILSWHTLLLLQHKLRGLPTNANRSLTEGYLSVGLTLRATLLCWFAVRNASSYVTQQM